MKPIKQLLLLEYTLEMRNKASLQGVLLYLIATIFLVYIAFQRISNPTLWNTLFWIILLFAIANAFSRSFHFIEKNKQLYWYTLLSAQHIIIARLLYSIVFSWSISAIAFPLYSILLGFPVESPFYFLLILLLGSAALAQLFTFVASVAAKATTGSNLTIVLALPILFPVLIAILKASKNAVIGLDWNVNGKYILFLLLFNILIYSLSYLLFPYLWKN